jgi:hypothetical protein
VIPGVRIRATAIESGLVTSVFTNESGTFNISKLLPGRYALSASLPGFQTQTLKGIELKEDSSYRYDFRLPVLSGKTAPEVSIDAAALQRADAFSDLVRDGLAKGEERAAFAMVRPMAIAAPPPPPPPILAPRELEADKDLGKREQFAGGLGNLVAADARKKALGFAEMRQEAVAYFTVREYAHANRPDWTEQSRVDFSETVYWNAGIKTDAATGVATVSFNLSDSVTSFRVLSDAFGFNGALGSGSSEIESVRPFFIEPKLPLQVTSGDVIQLPIGLINGLHRPLFGTEIHATAVDGLKFAAFNDRTHSLPASARADFCASTSDRVSAAQPILQSAQAPGRIAILSTASLLCSRSDSLLRGLPVACWSRMHPGPSSSLFLPRLFEAVSRRVSWFIQRHWRV